VRCGLIGTGHWARTVHAPALLQAADVDLAGVWGRNREATAALAAQLGVTAYDSADTLIQQVDLVDFAVPPEVQVPLAIRAAEAGRHLMLEKPIALSVDDAGKLVAAVERANVASLVFFTGHFQPETVKWVEEASGGGWVAGTGRWITSALSTAGSPYAASTWRQRSGALWDIGPHALSMMLPTLGPVDQVSAIRGEQDLIHVLLTHESGATSTLSLTLHAPPGTTIVDLTLWGPAGITTKPIPTSTPVEALSAALRTLVAEAAAGRSSHPCDVRFGLQVVSVLAQIESELNPAS
jgi:predicted dehydrogenase